MENARGSVIVSIAGLAEKYPEISASPPATDHLDARDAALAHTIYDGAVRRWITLAHLLEQAADRPWRTLEPAMKGVLLVGAAQLVLLDRVPVHAAIDESVRWAKARIRAGAAGFVNAVLRNVSRMVEGAERETDWSNRPDQIPLASGGSLTSGAFGLPDDVAERLAVGCGLPERLIHAWIGDVGLEGAMARARHSVRGAPVVLRIDAEPPDQSIMHESPNAAVWTGSHDELRQAIGAGAFWVQDATSADALDSISDLRPNVVVDMCAGLGTKTKQLRALFPESTIIAADPDARRFRELEATFRDDDRVEVVPSESLADRAAGRADLVLTDVPCSNTGVLARRVEARHRAGRRTIDRLVKIQRQVVRDAMPLLAPGGQILYATCSLEKLENEKQAAWAARELGLVASRQRLGEPRRTWSEQTAQGGADPAYRDGGYSVLLTPGPAVDG